VAKKRDERDERDTTCEGYVEGGEREAAKYLVNRPWEDEPPTCEGYVSEEAVRKYSSEALAEQLKQLKAAEFDQQEEHRRRKRRGRKA
jgi:hypothetical protein